MPATAEKLTPHAVVEMIALDKIVESPLNHRGKQSWGDMEGLAASIKEKGVLQPVLVRPKKGIGSNLYELVFGARRYRGTKAAGLAEIPAMVRDMSDVEVVEAQILENLARQDVHPMDEAEGLEQLLQPRGPYTVDDIAAKLGKSRGTIYARLKLLDLTKGSREAFYEGKVSPSTALYLARVPAELQPAALEAITPRWHDEGAGPMPARQASRILQQEFMHDLAAAPFVLYDADLVPAAGACSVCPRRTGAQADLFSDVEGANVCTAPDCYRSKVDATWERRKAAAEAGGAKVLTGKEAERAVGYDAPYVDLDSANYDDPKHRTYRKLLGKRAAEAVVLSRSDDGPIRELIPKKNLGALLRAAGHTSLRAPSAPKDGPSKEEKAKAKAAAELEAEVEKRQRAALVAWIEKAAAKDDRRVWAFAAFALTEYADLVLERRGIGEKDKDLAAYIDKLEDAALKGLVFECALDASLLPSAWGENAKIRKELLALAKVDEKALRAEAKKALEEKAKAAAPAKDDGGKPKKKGTCHRCGCKQNSPCPQGCAWTDKTQTLCTACASEDELDAASGPKSNKKGGRRA